MYLLLVAIVIALVIFAVNRRFSAYREDKLLMFAMKQSHLYLYSYNQNKSGSPEDIYIKVLSLEIDDSKDTAISAEKTLELLKQNYLSPQQKLTFREIVKFCVIRKIYETPEIKDMFSDSIRANLDSLIYCAFLPEEKKIETRLELDKKSLSSEEQRVFVQCLGTIEKAVNTVIPENY